MSSSIEREVRDLVSPAELLCNGSRVSLAEWLDVSWFYPDGFKKKQVVETPAAFIVLGESIAYKFFKESSSPDSISFEQRWRRACEEILDNRELAPDLYLGIRVLRWIDGEPHWITEVRGRDLNPNSPPPDADDVAVVMRRFPEHGKLSLLFEEEDDISSTQLDTMVKVLAKFHHKKRRMGQACFLENPEACLELLHSRYLGSLKKFMTSCASFLDPFSRTALQETKSFLDAYFKKNRSLFFSRGKSGWLVDFHGNLKTCSVAIKPFDGASRSISFFSRKTREHGVRMGDVLSDIASLVVDFEIHGYMHLAREFEKRYFARLEGVFDRELYRFYLAANAVLRAEELFKSANGKAFSEVTGFLALAFRYALGLDQPFIVAIGGPSPHGREDLAQGIAELTSAELLLPDKVISDLSMIRGLEPSVFDKLLSSAKRCVMEGSPVVLVWPFNREEERLQLVNLAKSIGIPYLLIKCQLSHEEQVRRGLSVAFDGASSISRRLWSKENIPWKKRELSQEIHQLLIEPMLSQSELALYVLRELLRQNQSR